jgi:hypothetical protein
MSCRGKIDRTMCDYDFLYNTDLIASGQFYWPWYS